jgi:hypothetical protein
MIIWRRFLGIDHEHCGKHPFYARLMAIGMASVTCTGGEYWGAIEVAS